ncbi:hypothetical protein LZ318_15755 [Saccharopolyspora indica]|uniref:bestrophin-like domain n=1 Tax=Saccharopolyspora indica TaxID=1229659 RepID=UPI0022EA49AE|nr:hypothetical protein [Saccharopolyspora indica]MDA3645958.1 hypothetical protein [Saccharopolyspora indica]
MVVIVIVVLVAALACGLTANLVLRRRDEDAEQGASVKDVLSPIMTLAVIFLAFVLVQGSTSFGHARDAASAEADAVDDIFELADYAPGAQREQIQGVLVCYARAVIHQGWGNESNSLSPAVNTWSSAIRTPFPALKTSDSSLFGMLVTADQKRAEERTNRVDEATADTPAAVYAFVLVALAIAVAGYAFTIPARRNSRNITAVVLLTAILIGAILLVRDLELPYSGPISIQPTAMERTEQDIAGDFATAFPASSPPCDDVGQRLP